MGCLARSPAEFWTSPSRPPEGTCAFWLTAMDSSCFWLQQKAPRGKRENQVQLISWYALWSAFNFFYTPSTTLATFIAWECLGFSISTLAFQQHNLIFLIYAPPPHAGEVATPHSGNNLVLRTAIEDVSSGVSWLVIYLLILTSAGWTAFRFSSWQG